MRRRPHLGIAALSALAGAAQAVQGQSVRASGATRAVIQSGAQITIPGVFGVNPGLVVQNSDSTAPCIPGACFDASATVHANTKWQLQVTLDPAPADFVVVWIGSRSPTTTHQLTPGVYQTVASGSTPTTSLTVPLLFNANKTTGQGGSLPTAAQLAAVLSYRVIAAP